MLGVLDLTAAVRRVDSTMRVRISSWVPRRSISPSGWASDEARIWSNVQRSPGEVVDLYQIGGSPLPWSSSDSRQVVTAVWSATAARSHLSRPRCPATSVSGAVHTPCVQCY